MSEELRSCPFCGRSAFYDGDDNIVCCTGGEDCVTGSMSGKSVEDWNHRPIEDALRKTIEHLHGAMNADDERLKSAAEKCGVTYCGCDTPDQMADEIIGLKEIIKEKNNLLLAYRTGNQNIADKALTKLEHLYKKLEHKPE